MTYRTATILDTFTEMTYTFDTMNDVESVATDFAQWFYADAPHSVKVLAETLVRAIFASDDVTTREMSNALGVKVNIERKGR